MVDRYSLRCPLIKFPCKTVIMSHPKPFSFVSQGRISPAELYIFFKEIHDMWVNVLSEYADLAIYDVVDELLDMVSAARRHGFVLRGWSDGV